TGMMNIMKYREGDRNQLANCMLLTAAENGAGGKSDTLPDEWFKDKAQDYLNRHLIPTDPALWKLERFEDFITERRKLIKAKFGYLLSVPTSSAPVQPDAKQT
ncbi:MAG: HNH endonuclease family protein, partial [Proteobacteria bacterium]|nr:HNH endonuclease family protein [Pseudomonadota bacterium]